MNEIAEQPDFDYSLVGTETAHKLKALSNQLDGIYQNYQVVVGEVLYQAQKELASYGDGVFGRWVESKGISKRNCYNYINSYKFVQNLHEPQKEIFNNSPKSLQFEISKPSANPEVNQAVFDGDITTHKQYKELERKLNQANADLSKARETADKYAEQVITLKTQQPQTITKEVVKEVVPDDYKATKQLNSTLLDKNKDLQRQYEDVKSRNDFVEKQLKNLYERRAEVDEKSAKYDELTEAIKQSEGQLDAYQKKIFAYKEVQSLLKKGNNMLSNMGGVLYVDIKPVLETEPAVRNELETFSFLLTSFAKEVAELLNDSDIIEGEIL